MELQNSYIFISKEPTEKKSLAEEETSATKISELLNKFFPNVISVSDLIGGGCQGYLNGVHVTFELNETPIADYFDVVVKHHYKSESVKCLETISNTIMKEDSDFQRNYVPIISFDSVSEYYSNRLHPKLNELDRKMRQLMFQIYTVHFGQDYSKTETEQELKALLSKSTERNIELVDQHCIDRIKEGIRVLRRFRNQASHCNFFYEKKYNMCMDLASNILDVVNEAIEGTEAKEVKEEKEIYFAKMKSYTERMSELFSELKMIGENICSMDEVLYVPHGQQN